MLSKSIITMLRKRNGRHKNNKNDSMFICQYETCHCFHRSFKLFHILYLFLELFKFNESLLVTYSGVQTKDLIPSSLATVCFIGWRRFQGNHIGEVTCPSDGVYLIVYLIPSTPASGLWRETKPHGSYQVCFNCQFSANDKFKASLFIFIITKIFVTVLSHWVSLNQLNADFFNNCISYHIWDRKAASCKKLPKVVFGKCSAEFMAIIIVAVVIVIIDTFPQFFFSFNRWRNIHFQGQPGYSQLKR